MTDLVRLESLRKTCDGPVTALEGVTTGVAAGGFTAVMGSSGSGKSTPLQCALPALTVEQNVLGQLGLAERSQDRAVVTTPAVIFADEPAGALDLRSVREMLALLRSVVDQYGRTVDMVTHDQAAASYADTVVSRGLMS